MGKGGRPDWSGNSVACRGSRHLRGGDASQNGPTNGSCKRGCNKINRMQGPLGSEGMTAPALLNDEPRGRSLFECHLHFMQVVGQGNDREEDRQRATKRDNALQSVR